MTDNEKAATFIDWVPTNCKGEKLKELEQCKACGNWHRAPSMDEAENYMEAVEAIRKWGDGGLLVDNGYDFYFHHVPKDIRLRSGCCETAGEAVMAVLAALYDALGGTQ